MSFDLFLSAFRNGNSVPANREAALEVIRRHHLHPVDDRCGVKFADGSSADFHHEGLTDVHRAFEGGMLAIRQLSLPVATFVFELAAAAGYVIIPAMEPMCVLIPEAGQSRHLPRDLEDCKHIPVRRGEDVMAAIASGYKDWKEYHRTMFMQYQTATNAKSVPDRALLG